jgi:hypothetical protein
VEYRYRKDVMLFIRGTVMADDDFKYKEVATGLPAETALDVAAVLANFIPGLGGAVSNVLSGMSVGRRLDRVKEVLQGLADELSDLKSEASERYVRTDEFEELLETVLRRAAEERNEQRRQLLRHFLVGTIVHPGSSYDTHRAILRLLESAEPEDVLVLRAAAEQPTADEMAGLVGSIIGTLQRRLAGWPPQRIEAAVTRLNDLRIINLTPNRMHTMMTAPGAAELRGSIMPIGQELIAFLTR